MKVIAAILCLAAAANAASVFPVESSVVKSDRVGDNFSYSIHQNQGYAAVDSGVAAVYPYEVKTDKVKDVVSAATYVAPAEYKQIVPVAPIEVKHVVPVSPVEVKATEYKHVVPLGATEYKHVVPISPVEIKATEYKHVVPISPVEIKATEYKQVVPVSPVEVKATEYKQVVPAGTYLSSPVKSYVKSSAVVAPVKTLSYVQPSSAYVPALTYSHDAAVPFTYGANIYPYSYATYAYPYVNAQKVY
ncbi:uncharacterized protein [Periplaneta americana]|uniref:uncharacterized protein n=1 Tax=Periplaneta americana TaxID=6978 RepID=UPI0037E7249E